MLNVFTVFIRLCYMCLPCCISVLYLNVEHWDILAYILLELETYYSDVKGLSLKCPATLIWNLELIHLPYCVLAVI
jgi:hypothetical protein